MLIVQNDVGNKFSPTVIAAAITSQKDKADLPTHISVDAQGSGLLKDSIVLLEQVRTLDKHRLREKMGTPGQAVHAPGGPGTLHQLWPERYIAGRPAAPGDPGAAFPLSSRFAAGCRIFPPAAHKGGQGLPLVGCAALEHRFQQPP